MLALSGFFIQQDYAVKKTPERRTTHEEKLAQRAAARSAKAEQTSLIVEKRRAERKAEKLAKMVARLPTEPMYVSDFETYRPNELRRRLGLGSSWLKKARADGLKVILIGAGNRILIDGRELRRYLATHQQKPTQDVSPTPSMPLD